MSRIVSRLIVTIAVISLAATPLLATNGYFSHGQGTANKSMAGAGIAVPNEPLDALYNPAAISFVPAGYTAGLALFSPHREYTVTGNPSGYPGTFPLAPGTVASESELFPMPSLAGNFKLTDKSTLAVSFVAHGGMDTDYRTDTFHGSDHTGVNLAQMFLTTTYAYRINENHSVGISGIVAYQRFKASGLEAFTLFSSDPEHVTNQGTDTSWGFGAKIGYLGHLSKAVSVGASYSPTIKMSEFDKYSGLFAGQGSFDIPSSMALGLSWRATDRLTMALDAERIHYSDVRAVGNHMFPNLMEGPLGGDEGSGFGWNDVDVYKIGAQYVPNQNWTWRFGYSHGDQPIPETEMLFNILAPGVIENHFTAGFSRKMSKSNSHLNMAFMYAPQETVSGPNPLEAPGQQQIELKMYEYEIEVSYSFGF